MPSKDITLNKQICQIELENINFDTNPKTLKSLLYKQAKNYEKSKGTAKDNALEMFGETLSKAIYIHSLENHVDVAGTVHETYQPLVIEMTERVINDFSCTAAHEKALAGVIASSYTRYIQYSSKFANAQLSDSMSKEKTQYYTMFSKEADKAHRQFLGALTTLQQLKSPTPTINVKTNTAFVAQNQQNNAVNGS